MKKYELNVGKAGLLMALCMLVAGLLLTGCSKSDDSGDGGNPNLFKPSDFEVIINKKEALSDSYRIEFEVRNKRNVPFDYNVNGDYKIRFKVKTTDGNEYQNEMTMLNMSANGSFADISSIVFPSGKTINQSTFSYEIFLDE